MINEHETKINNLSESINAKRSKNTATAFKEALAVFGGNISTKFLRGLVNESDGRKQTKRINYLLKIAGLKTHREERQFKKPHLESYRATITEYATTDGLIYANPCGLLEEEAKQIAEIESISKKSGVELNGTAQDDLNERQRQRNAINKAGGVRVKEIRLQSVGKFFISPAKEILFFVDI